jgi:hypothetical protein
MVQRLGLACALVGDPELLILDEPASALDPAGRAEMLDMVAAMRGRRTVIFSSHILADVQRIAQGRRRQHRGRRARHPRGHRRLRPPGLLRAGRRRPRIGVPRPDRHGPSEIEMSSAARQTARGGRMSLWRLERLRLVQTPRALALGAVSIALGLLEPVATRYQSQIFSRVGNGVRISFPPVTPAAGVSSYVGELGGIGLIVVVVIAAGAFSFDAHRGLAMFLRTRVGSIWQLVTPRSAVNAAAAATAYLLGTVGRVVRDAVADRLTARRRDARRDPVRRRLREIRPALHLLAVHPLGQEDRHDVTHREHAGRGPLLQHHQVPDAPLVHLGRGDAHVPVGRGGHDRGGHVLADPRLPDVAEPGGGVHHVALGEDAGDLAALLHDHRADAVLGHDLSGLLQRLVGVDRDHRAPHEVPDLHGKGLLGRTDRWAAAHGRSHRT